MKPSDEYIIGQPEKYQNILLHLIAVIEKLVPDSQLLIKYGIPFFYYKKKPFCYLAPNHKKEFVDVGFSKGFQLNKNQEFLVGENRNTVKSLRYFSLESINNKILESVIEEATNLYN